MNLLTSAYSAHPAMLLTNSTTCSTPQASTTASTASAVEAESSMLTSETGEAEGERSRGREPPERLCEGDGCEAVVEGGGVTMVGGAEKKLESIWLRCMKG